MKEAIIIDNKVINKGSSLFCCFPRVNLMFVFLELTDVRNRLPCEGYMKKAYVSMWNSALTWEKNSRETIATPSMLEYKQ